MGKKHYHIRLIHSVLDILPFVSYDWEETNIRFEQQVASIKRFYGIETKFHGRYVAEFEDGDYLFIDICEKDCIVKPKNS